MNLRINNLNYRFSSKPLLIGGKAKEYFKLRKAGKDIDLVVTEKDFKALLVKYPEKQKELYGDLGICVKGFEIWKSICLFEYKDLSIGAVETPGYKIISLEKLLFLTALAMRKRKYMNDLKMIVKKVLDNQYNV